MTMKGFNPTCELSMGAVLTLANGYAGTRDLLKEGHLACRSDTFLAGVFDPILKSSEPPTETDKSPRLICAPDWSNLIIEINGQPVVLESKQLLAHERTLDLYQSVLVRHWRQRLQSGHIRLAVVLDGHTDKALLPLPQAPVTSEPERE